MLHENFTITMTALVGAKKIHNSPQSGR